MTNSEETEAETENKEGRQVSSGDREQVETEKENMEGRQVRSRARDREHGGETENKKGDRDREQAGQTGY